MLGLQAIGLPVASTPSATSSAVWLVTPFACACRRDTNAAPAEQMSALAPVGLGVESGAEQLPVPVYRAGRAPVSPRMVGTLRSRKMSFVEHSAVPQMPVLSGADPLE